MKNITTTCFMSLKAKLSGINHLKHFCDKVEKLVSFEKQYISSVI